MLRLTEKQVKELYEEFKKRVPFEMTDDLVPGEHNGLDVWNVGSTLVNFQKAAGDQSLPYN